MLEIFQQTLSAPVNISGKGLHTGKFAKVKILPGVENQGIIFKRVDLKNNNLIKANFKMFPPQSFAQRLKMNSMFRFLQLNIC